MVTEYLTRESEGSGESATYIIPTLLIEETAESIIKWEHPKATLTHFRLAPIIGTRLFSSLCHLDFLKRLCYNDRVSCYYNI